jgi:hypothetical protein
MTTMARGLGLPRQLGQLIPWVVGASLLLYIVGYLDGSVHAAAVVGNSGLAMDYVHEFFHHARHIALMCH